MWDHGFVFLLPSLMFKYPLLLDLIYYSLNDFEQEITWHYCSHGGKPSLRPTSKGHIGLTLF